ncbi:hypothetical protein BJV78DRAFT_1356521, partial [Lactifluus subvellereus]
MHVPVDVDPPAKRQRTGGAYSLSLKAAHSQPPPPPLLAQAASPPEWIVISFSLKNSQSR